MLTFYIWQLSWHQTCSQKPCNVSHDNKNMDSYINFEVIRSKFKAQFYSTLRRRKLATLWSISSKSLFVPTVPCKKSCNFFIIATWGYLFLVFLTASQLDKFQYCLYHLVVPMCDLNDRNVSQRINLDYNSLYSFFVLYKKKQNRFCFIKSLYILVHMHMYGSVWIYSNFWKGYLAELFD